MIDFKTENLVILHLEGFEEFRDEEEVPYGITPRGITRAVGITESAPYSTLENVEEKDLIEEKTKKVIGQNRERNVYFLTDKGKKKFEELWSEIKDEKIILKSKQEEKEVPLKELEKHLGGRNPISRGLRVIDDENVIDISEFENEVEVFVGRHDELNKLKKKMKNVKEQGTDLIFIEGEAGIGKTSLVSKLRPFAKELGFKFLKGTCQSETSDPYLPFKEAFSDYIEGEKKEKTTTGMAFIGGDQSDQPVKEKELFDAKKKETFYETTKYVKEITQENSLVVFLDDLQWVDKATLDILVYMNDKLEDEPVFFIGTYRPEDVSEDHHLVEAKHRLEREGDLDEMSLEPLTREDTKETITGVLGTEEIPHRFIETLHEKTEGNPLFIKESIRQMEEEGMIDVDKGKFPEKSDEFSMSEMVFNVIERRINRLDDDTVKVIEIGSVIGDSIPFGLLSKTAEMDQIDLLDHVDMLIGNQLWDESPEEELFYFSHELIRETVYDRIKRLKKKLLHKRVANNIEERYEDELQEWYSELGRHHERAENYTDALGYYIKAGEKAESVFANEDAVRTYEKALALSKEVKDEDLDRLEIIEKIAKAYSLLGEYEKTREYLNQGLDVTDKKKEKQRLLRKIADTYHMQGKWDESFEYIEDGLTCVEEENKETCKLLSLKGWSHVQRGLSDEAEDIFEKEKEIAEKIDNKEEMGQVYHDLGTTRLRKGDLEDGIELLEKAIEIRKDIDDKLELQKSFNNLGIVYSDKGDYEEAEKYYRKSLEACEDTGNKSGIAASLNNLGTIQNKRGKLDEAINTFKESLEMSERIGDEHGKAISLTNLASLYLMRGELEKANESLKETSEIREETEDKLGVCIDLSIESTMKKKKGKLDEAIEKIKESKELAKETDSKRDLAIANHRLGEFFFFKGKFEKAIQQQMEAKDMGEEIGARDIESFTREGLARVKLRQGNVDEAIELNEEGLEIAEELNDQELMGTNLLGLAKDKLEKEELEQSYQYLQKVNKIVEKREDPNLSLRNKFLKSKYEKENNNLKKAREIMENALEESKISKDKVWRAKILFELGVIESTIEGETSHKVNQALTMFEEMGMNWWKNKVEEFLSEVR